MQDKKKLLIIGLGGATFDLIDPWIKEGKLPTLAKISKLGIKRTLRTTIPPLTPCAWSSFAAGKNPGKHGIYDFYFINKDLELDVNTCDKRPGKDFWEILSEHGKKVIVFNVPMTFPPRKVNGIIISGFTTPDLQSNLTYPEGFKNELLRNFPDYQISEKAKFSENYSDQKLFLNEIKKLTDIQAKVSRWLMKSFDWDVFIVVFNDTDHAQHWYWKYFDKEHPLYENNKKFKNAIYEVYNQADRIISDLYYKAAPKNTSLMIISDHGAGQYLKNVYLNNWLYKKGYLKFKNTPGVLLGNSLF